MAHLETLARPLAAAELPGRAAATLGRLRAEHPRIHAITNAAAQALTANLLLAAGGVPSLTVAADEAAAFAGRAGALLVNLGTLDAERRAAIPWAVATVRAAGRPWVLDPVFVEASPSRLALARLALSGGPAVIRCNAAEFAALAGPDDPAAFAAARGCVVALTGATDRITDGRRILLLDNGHPFMGQVTAMGCAATALVAAFTALDDDAFAAAAGALLAVGVAGEIAGRTARGPGSFVPAFLDAVFALDEAALAAHARVS